ncbi:Hypothetical protein BSSP2_II0646 [Brucella suis bv. 2]|nr:Hypothetical protein BSSP3_II0649 [Brucella suis bv. 2]AIB22709.1 Hypothetical protein BSPT1_II0634 [Brucella suis bv. 2]AIB26067.1 Hypothetical protein BSPT2_II0637 [Brucella suis bv. 2]AIB29459.1 Hypothetical protein BSSP1_II0637 [Brucella suis bv. 2]AIB32836.1 Hypothetical protein BSSP2_II0646 [Brucella suis bv. 2]
MINIFAKTIEMPLRFHRPRSLRSFFIRAFGSARSRKYS